MAELNKSLSMYCHIAIYFVVGHLFLFDLNYKTHNTKTTFTFHLRR